MDVIKALAPYVVSVITAVIAYLQAKKGYKTEIEKLETQHKNELETLVKQHEIDIENLKQKHAMDMESKEKDYKHEIEMQKVKSEASINEKNQEVLSNVMVPIFQDLMNGKIKPEDIKNLAKQFPSNNERK